MHATPFARAVRRAALLAVGALFACSGGGDSSGPGSGSIAMSLDLSVVSVAIGGTGAVTATVTRTGTFSGAVTFSVANLPTGVTVASNTQNTNGTTTTAVITFAGGNSATAGSSTVTVSASGSGVKTISATLTLSLTSSGGGNGSFTLSVSQAALSLAQGANGQTTLTISRTAPFAGAVVLTVEGAPAGLTPSLNPTSVTGATSTLTLTATASLATGTYNLTVRGTASGATQQTVAVAVTITATGGGSGSVTLNFSQCNVAQRPVWVAFLDGESGTWVRVTGTNDTYTFTITQAKGGYAYVTPQQAGATHSTTVFFGTRAEVSAGGAPTNFCNAAAPPTRTITGTVAGLSGGEAANVYLGGRPGIASPALPNFTLSNVPDGAHDLVVFRSTSAPSAQDRGLIRQDQTLVHNTNVGTLDVSGAESFAAATGNFTLNGVAAGSIITSSVVFLSGASCDASALTGYSPATSPFLLVGIPDARMRAGDMHMVSVGATTATTGTRSVTEVFHSMADRAIDLPPEIAPAVIQASGAYKRLNSAFILAADYNVFVALTYFPLTGVRNTVSMTATVGWTGTGAAVGLVTPDFGGVNGWDDSWAPAANAVSNWTITAAGQTPTILASLCTPGLRMRTATRTGQN